MTVEVCQHILQTSFPPLIVEWQVCPRAADQQRPVCAGKQYVENLFYAALYSNQEVSDWRTGLRDFSAMHVAYCGDG